LFGGFVFKTTKDVGEIFLSWCEKATFCYMVSPFLRGRNRTLAQLGIGEHKHH